MSRELDRAIGKELGTQHSFRFIDKEGEAILCSPFYSSCGNAMLELIKELKKRGWFIKIEGDASLKGKYRAWVMTDGFSKLYDNVYGVSAFADTMPEAVAKAWIKAKTGKEWVE